MILLVGRVLSILMPALGKAREQAKQTVFMTHLKSLGLGVGLYSFEHDDRRETIPRNGGEPRMDTNVHE